MRCFFHFHHKFFTSAGYNWTSLKLLKGVTCMGLALIGMALITVLFFAWFVAIKRQILALKNVKRAEDRERRVLLSKSLRMAKWGLVASIIGVVVTGSLSIFGTQGNKGIYLEHVHGLGFSTDGKRILIPAHDGLKAYEEGRWETPEGAKHDYMGFSPVNDGFYSSGHPAPGSDLKDPLGMVKSTDEGKSMKMLGLEGETDFHNMAVGYKSHVIYVINPQPNSKMSAAGLYYSKDEGGTWTKSEMKGVNVEPSSMAVHPFEASVLAIGTPNGVYLSKDYGNSFEQIASDEQATALFFNKQGELFIGGYQKQAYLQKMDIWNKKGEKLTIPTFFDDAIAYLSQNPIDDNQIAFATFNKDVYISKDKGLNWRKIADKGNTISEEKTEQ